MNDQGPAMGSPFGDRPTGRQPAGPRLGLFLLAAYGLAVAGFACRVSAHNVSVFWPVNGLLLATLLMAPYGRWPILLALATAATWLADVTWFGWEWHTWWQRISLASVIETALGAWLMRRFLRFPHQLDRLANVLAFLLFIVVIGALVGSFIGAAEVAHLFPETPRWSILQRWWFGDGLGLLIVTPVVLAAWEAWEQRRFNWGGDNAAQQVEAGVVALGTVLLTHALFAAEPRVIETAFELPYVLWPWLLWACLRLPLLTSSSLVLTVAVQVVYFTAHHRGPFVFAGQTLEQNVLVMQAFLAVASTASLLMTSVVADRKRAMLKLERTNQQLQASEQRYRGVVQDQTELIVRWRPDGTRTFVNDAYCRYYATLREHLLGTSRWESIHEEDRARVRESIGRLTPDISAVEGEYRVQRSDDQVGWQQWIDRGFFNEAGQLVELQSVGRDITQRKQTEERLQRQETVMQHFSRVASLGELAAGISHEISQPLTAIDNWAHTLRMVVANFPKHHDNETSWRGITEATEAIVNANHQAVQILRRVKDFVKPVMPARTTQSLADIVTESMALVNFVLRKYSVRVDVSWGEDSPKVTVDRVQIEQVFVNLFTNAAESMQGIPRDQRVIRITAQHRPPHIWVTVVDQGPGLPPELAHQLGQPFLTTKIDGMGLGLSICCKIIAAHGGEFTYRPAAGGGAEFGFSLPE